MQDGVENLREFWERKRNKRKKEKGKVEQSEVSK